MKSARRAWVESCGAMDETRIPAIQTVCMLGLGYVGLPMAAMLAINGFRVIGVDVRADVVEAINAGHVPIEEVGLNTVVQAAVNSGNLRAQREPAPADAFIIAVPTPIARSRRTCARATWSCSNPPCRRGRRTSCWCRYWRSRG
jgi:UDP-N-acetyl-D-mannosaminuronate dehydrogenase